MEKISKSLQKAQNDTEDVVRIQIVKIGARVWALRTERERQKKKCKIK